MRVHVSDWQWAVVAAMGLLGFAAFVIFGFHPGGFETQIGWFLLLLPGEFIAAPVADQVYKLAPRAEEIVFWMLLMGLSFLWYWGISYSIIKISRVVARITKPRIPH